LCTLCMRGYAKMGGEMIGGRWRELGPLEKYCLGTREIVIPVSKVLLSS
jgi:hypothetical protein